MTRALLNGWLAITAVAGFGVTIKFWEQQQLVNELRAQIVLLHRIVELQDDNVELTEQNCGSVHAIEGLCEATLTDLVNRLGIADQLDPLIRTAVWRRLQEAAPTLADIKAFTGMGGD